jgi:hypothetical protein
MNGRSFLAAVLLVTGCASADQYVYTKPGASTEQKERDKTDCLFDSRVTTQGPEIRVNQDRYRRCMTDKGYTLERTAQ